MKCEVCGKSPSDGVTTLIRQNAKGVPGVWRCESCNRIKPGNAVSQVIAEIQNLRNLDKPKH